jgi:hypothetical protein
MTKADLAVNRAAAILEMRSSNRLRLAKG